MVSDSKRRLRIQPSMALELIRGGKARKRVDVLLLHQDLVRELRSIRPRTALPSASVFPATVGHETRRKDFDRAGIQRETEDGFADLHSLRHTYGSRLVEAGVDSIYLRSLMRHQSLQMTLEYYIHLDDEGIYKRLCRLPSVEGPHRVRQKTSANS